MQPRVLVIDDERPIAQSLQSVLEAEGYSAAFAITATSGLEDARRHTPDVVVCDIQLPDRSGLEVLEALRECCPRAVVIMITAYATVENAIQALKLGASDYLLKPILFDDLLHRIDHLLTHRRLELETQYLRRSLSRELRDRELVGNSPAMRQVQALIEQVARTTTTVLITGESGTGKELVARGIHRASPQAGGPFLAINCGAIPENLLESELFGYRKGAFSGADRNKEGLLELAQDGTLFLDEIGDLPLVLQPKLLRAIEQKEFIPLGGERPVRVSTRCLTASNRDLTAMVAGGQFRADLLYRLNLIEINVPPLRDRRADIPLLVGHIINKLNRELGRTVKGVEPEVLALLCAAAWPGNVRELENVIQRAMILHDREFLEAGDFWQSPGAGAERARTLKEAVRRFERQTIEATIARCGGDKRRAAVELEISLASLYAKLKEPETGPAERGQAVAGSGAEPAARADSSRLEPAACFFRRPGSARDTSGPSSRRSS